MPIETLHFLTLQSEDRSVITQMTTPLTGDQ